ncbi:MAG: GNAT family N-acetyltransferase [Pseudomonadota bacterium]
MTHPSGVIETERLIMRPVLVDDVDYAIRLREDELILKYHFHGKYYNDEEMAERIKVWINIYNERGYGFLMIFEKGVPEEEGFIGKAALWKVDELSPPEQLEIAYLLLEAHRGKGYATEVAKGLVKYSFEVLDKENVVALIEAENEPSKRVIGRLGFKYEQSRVLPTRGEMEYEIYRLNRD